MRVFSQPRATLFSRPSPVASTSCHPVPPARTFAQLAARLHGEAPIQRRGANGPTLDLAGIPGPGRPPRAAVPLPAALQAQVEARSGLPMHDVRVHRDSDRPARIGALAYAQGRDIHLGPGQEPHLAHEAWHVVQQKQGRVRATGRVGGLPVNDEFGLEREAQAGGRGTTPEAAPAGDRDTPSDHRAEPVSETAAIQFYRPLASDHGRLFLIRRHADDAGSVGTYVYEQNPGGPGYLFNTRGGPIRLGEDDIIGYRPTVSLKHPPGRVRPVSERLEGRNRVFLSEADMSGIHARMRKDITLTGSAIATTYESASTLENLYPDYLENLGHIERQGIPVVHNVDLSNVPGSVNQLHNMSSNNPHLHFQMPRVPRMKGYSTQQLIRDTNRVASGLSSNLSYVLPDPQNYKDVSSHKRFYGMHRYQTGKPTEEAPDMTFTSMVQDPDQDLEEYGYVHKKSTEDESADVADRRMRYNFTYSAPSEHEDEKDKGVRKWRDDRDPGSGDDAVMT